MRDPVTVQRVGTITCDVPDHIFDAIIISLSTHDDGGADMTTTGLLKPPQMVHLQRSRWQEITLPASRFLYRLWGTLVHWMREKAGVMPERMFFAKVLGWTIKGQPDDVDGTTLIDLKTLSAYEGKRHASPEKAKAEKIQQGNVNAHLARLNGLTIDRLVIEGIVRDWRPSEARREKGYPTQAISFDLPVWEDDECARFLEERVRIHQAAREGKVAPCTASERWARGGVPVRCESYCDVASVCPQFNNKEAIEH